MTPPPAGDAGGAGPQPLVMQALSDRGIYRVAIKADVAPLPLRSFHTWHARLTTADGKLVVPHSFTLRGGMPGHSHGLPTAPQITPTETEGEFLIEGVKFNMAGRWVFAVQITADQGTDDVLFEFDVGH